MLGVPMKNKKKKKRTKEQIQDDLDDKEIWAKIAEIWQTNELAKDEELSKDQALPYVQDYMQQLDIDVDQADQGEIDKIFAELDEDGNGSISRDEMYNHLKKTKGASALGQSLVERKDKKKAKARAEEEVKKQEGIDLKMWKKV